MTDSSVPKVIPKVVIVASNVSSRFGGEAFLPLKYFQLLRARGYPVKLITHARNRVDLQHTLKAHLDDIIFVEDTLWHKIIWNVGERIPGRVTERLTQLLLDLIDNAYQANSIRRLIAEGQADLIHQPIPVSPVAPSGLHKYGKPLIIGPMNGGMNYPPGYRDYEKNFERLSVRFARKLAPLANRLVPGKHHAKTLLVANQRTRDAIGFLNHPNVIELVENGVDLRLFENTVTDEAVTERGLRLVYMGRMPRLKALDITLHAMAKAKVQGGDIRLDILGDGEERANLEALVRELDLDAQVTFHGFLPQEHCATILQKSHALILNSLRECGGAVVLEAMSIGRPAIVADWGGPADYVDPNCGILVSPAPRATFADRLADAMLRLADDPDLRQKMGAAGARKVREQFDWEKKVDGMISIYKQSVSDTSLDGERVTL